MIADAGRLLPGQVTPNEYRSRHADGIQGDPVEEKYRPGKVRVT